jgi:hypothetical protein
VAAYDGKLQAMIGPAFLCRLLLSAGVLALPACASLPNAWRGDIDSAFDAAVDHCASRSNQSAAAFTRCANRAFLRWWDTRKHDHRDLAEQAAAQKLAAAEQFDRRLITANELEKRQKHAGLMLAAELQRRGANEVLIEAASPRSQTCRRIAGALLCL